MENISSSMSDFELGLALGAHANEFGSTTGRPRQVGVLDLVLLKDASRFGGVDELILNSLDMMKYFNKSRFGGIPIVTAYEFNGKIITNPPLGTYDLGKVKPITKVLPGFDEDITGIRKFVDLPIQARNLVDYVQNYLQDVGTKVTAVGVGPRRDQIIFI